VLSETELLLHEKKHESMMTKKVAPVIFIGEVLQALMAAAQVVELIKAGEEPPAPALNGTGTY
jgi:hypothetical protein